MRLITCNTFYLQVKLSQAIPEFTTTLNVSKKT